MTKVGEWYFRGAGVRILLRAPIACRPHVAMGPPSAKYDGGGAAVDAALASRPSENRRRIEFVRAR